jgi:hypothetical protein
LEQLGLKNQEKTYSTVLALMFVFLFRTLSGQVAPGTSLSPQTALEPRVSDREVGTETGFDRGHEISRSALIRTGLASYSPLIQRELSIFDGFDQTIKFPVLRQTTDKPNSQNHKQMAQ